MSSRIQMEISKRVWKDKLDFFFCQPVDQFYDSMEIFKTAETSERVPINSKINNSKFMKFFKVYSHSEDEHTSASGNENSSGDCEYDFKLNRLGNLPMKVKLTNFLQNGWDVSINNQRGLVLRQILCNLPNEIIAKRANSRKNNSRNLMKCRNNLRNNYY